MTQKYADDQKMLDELQSVTHGWKPRSGFLKDRWRGYDEATLLYVLARGSPTFPLPEESYPAWLSSYRWRKIYDYEFIYAGPLFVHQLSHIWIDFRGIQDDYVRARGLDYFENRRRATYVQQQYAIRNPLASFGFAATFNPTYPVKSRNEYGWISPWKYGLNEGPIVIMIENYRTGLVWRLMRQCPYIVNGLRRAGIIPASLS